MNKRIFNRIMSLVLVVVMTVSTMMVSAVSVSAESVFEETENVSYYVDFHTAGSDGKSKDNILIKVNGENGSTDWHVAGEVAKNRNASYSFADIDVGTIESITVTNDDDNGWYPEYINITVGETTTTIYGGRWVDNGNEVTLSVTDRVAKVNVQISSNLSMCPGTDGNLCVKLIDDKGNSTGHKNLTEIHPKANAFEFGDRSTFYIYIPDNFGELKKIDVHVKQGELDNADIDYIEVALDGETKVFPCNRSVGADIKTLSTVGYLYKVTVKTSDVKYAGTDNNVYMNVYDKNQKFIERYFLDGSGNNFEKDDTDIFYVASPKKIIDIKIYTTYNTGTDWHLDYVQLDMVNGGNVLESVKYKFKKWLKATKEYAPAGKEILSVE